MRIAFFVTSLNVGGIENYLLRFLNYSKNQIEPVIICKAGFIGEMKEKYAAIPNIQFHVLKLGYFDVKGFYQVFKMLKNQNIRTVCDFTGDFAGLVMLVSKLAGVKKRIAFYRGSTNHFQEDFFRIIYTKLVRSFVYYFSSDILFNSKTAQLFFFGEKSFKRQGRFKVIYNGIDVQHFISQGSKLDRKNIGVPEDGFIIGHSGRYDKAKNHETIIRTASRICKKYPNIFFVLCGSGVKENLSEIIQSKGLGENVILLGYREDVSSVLALCDLFIFPSVTEGQPNSLIEAMAMGLPFLASNIDPIKETVPDKLVNKLIDPYDDNAFVDQIEKIYLDPELRKQFQSDPEWVKEKYDPNQQFSQFLEKLI